MTFVAARRTVLNRGAAPVAFLNELVRWAQTAPAEIFAPNPERDIYSKVRPELGPYRDLTHRKGVMLEVLRVLALFESSCDWTEGVDTSRLGKDTNENAEAGAWQVSYDARGLAPGLKPLLYAHSIYDGVAFQRAMKFDHPLAMEFVARLMRYSTNHNGPLYKGSERAAIRKSLRRAEHSIYPWLRRDAVEEFVSALFIAEVIG